MDDTHTLNLMERETENVSIVIEKVSVLERADLVQMRTNSDLSPLSSRKFKRTMILNHLSSWRGKKVGG